METINSHSLFQLLPNEQSLFDLLRKIFIKLNIKSAAYVAGGFIRDKLMKRDSKDIDIIIQRNNFRKIVDYIKDYGKNLGITSLGEHTLKARPVKGETLFKCKYKDLMIDIRSFQGEIYQDALNRDFTINSIYMDITTMDILDPLNGFVDISSKLLRPVESSKKIFSDSFERFIRLGKLIADGFVPSNELKIYVKNYFINQEFRNTRISAKSMDFQMNKVFQSKKCSAIFKELNDLKITRCFKKFFLFDEIEDNKYSSLINHIETLETILYDPLFEKFVETLQLTKSYDQMCCDLKKIMTILILANAGCYIKLRHQITDFIFKLDNYNDHLLENLLSDHYIFYRKTDINYFSRKSAYPLLGIIVICLQTSKLLIKNNEIISLIKSNLI